MGRSADLPWADRPRQCSAATVDDTGCTVLHVDMDAFYAAVEVRHRPELRGVPVVVAGGGTRGVVLSASYQARAFGVRSAMPVARARRLCPQAVLVPPDFRRYTEVSRGVMAIFREITPLVEPLSLDEAFLDVSGALRRLGMSPAVVGEWVRAWVADDHGLTCSVGVAPSKFLAKLASGMAKPDGALVVPAGGVREFLHPLPVSALWGVGTRTAEQLHALGAHTVADVAATPLPVLRRAVGGAVAQHLHALAHGRDERRVIPDAPEKSLGAEETFDADVTDRAVLHRELLRLAERATVALRRRGLRARTVTVKIRYPNFSTVSRARTLPEATDVGREVHRVALELLEGHLPPGARVRLLGLRLEQLTTAAVQLALDAPARSWPDVERAADRARSRFGAVAVRPATLLGADERPGSPQQADQWLGGDSGGGHGAETGEPGG